MLITLTTVPGTNPVPAVNTGWNVGKGPANGPPLLETRNTLKNSIYLQWVTRVNLGIWSKTEKKRRSVGKTGWNSFVFLALRSSVWSVQHRRTHALVLGLELDKIWWGILSINLFASGEANSERKMILSFLYIELSNPFTILQQEEAKVRSHLWTVSLLCYSSSVLISYLMICWQ